MRFAPVGTLVGLPCLGRDSLASRLRSRVMGDRSLWSSGLPVPLEHLLFTEVLDDVRRLCLSQDRRAPAMLGTGFGDRLRDARAMYVRLRGNKKAICWPFVKPPDGLEP